VNPCPDNAQGPTAEEAGIAWANGLDFLAGYLRHVPPEGGAPIFIDG